MMCFLHCCFGEIAVCLYDFKKVVLLNSSNIIKQSLVSCQLTVASQLTGDSC